MSNDIWSKMLSGDELSKAKKKRGQTFLAKKELTSNLPVLVDEGWEKYREYKDPRYILVHKDKSVEALFEDKIWLIFQKMGFTEITADSDFYLPYDYHDRSKERQIDILAADNETVLIVDCHASETITEGDFTEEILALKAQMDGIRREVVRHYSNHKVKFIWATQNYTLKRKDLDLLDEAGIIHFNDSEFLTSDMVQILIDNYRNKIFFSSSDAPYITLKLQSSNESDILKDVLKILKIIKG